MDTTSFKQFLLTEQVGKKRLRGKRTVDLHLQLLRRLEKEVPSLSPKDITAFLYQLFEKGRKGTYLNDFIDTLHVYGRFLKTDIYQSLQYFPEDDFEKAILSDVEIERFLSLPPPVTTRLDRRSGKTVSYVLGEKRWIVKTMFWKCLAYSGCRPGEIATLTTSCVDVGRQVFVVTGKTGVRIVPISPAILHDVISYVENLSGEYLFPSEKGGVSKRQGHPVIDDVDWSYDFHSRLKRLGIHRKNLTPYSLRHSFITRMLNEDVNLYKVQNLVGHKQGSAVTSTYYHLTTKSLVKTIKEDPLSRRSMTYDERFKLFRENVRELLENFTDSVVEEKKMLSDLVSSLLLLTLFIPLYHDVLL